MMDTSNEVLDRTRRIETRLTRLIQAMGFDPGSQKPQYDEAEGVLHVPSRHVSLQECLTAIPADRAVKVQIKGEPIAVLLKEETR